MEPLYEKQRQLHEIIAGLGSAAVAFSGGVDSAFLLVAAHRALSGRVLAVTARSLSFPARELEEARSFCRRQGIAQAIVDSEELEIAGFSQNPVNRCYLCKRELFTKIKTVARQNAMAYVLEGSNADDGGDFRPGLTAVAEQGILSPLRQVGLCKEEIRRLSQELGLPTWDKQSFACLASRFPYGEAITPERLRMVDEAEQFLLDLGFHQIRVRFHHNLARIETDQAGLATMADATVRQAVDAKLREIGFVYVALDLRGYRTGSMNETLSQAAPEGARK